jgi:hypothetical protein
MAMCPDFLNKEGMMEHVGLKLGVVVMLTSKCHAEMAGKGVEYMWACSKGAYCNLTLKDKKGEKLIAGDRNCLLLQVKSVQRIRIFGRQAQQYLLASTMQMTTVNAVVKYNKSVPSMDLLHWRNWLGSSKHIDVHF